MPWAVLDETQNTADHCTAGIMLVSTCKMSKTLKRSNSDRNQLEK